MGKKPTSAGDPNAETSRKASACANNRGASATDKRTERIITSLFVAAILLALVDVIFGGDQPAQPGSPLFHTESQSRNVRFVTADQLNARLGPSTNAKITKRLHTRQQVEVFEVRDGWARISKYYDGSAVGASGQVATWVSNKYLSTTQPARSAQPSLRKDPRS